MNSKEVVTGLKKINIGCTEYTSSAGTKYKLQFKNKLLNSHLVLMDIDENTIHLQIFSKGSLSLINPSEVKLLLVELNIKISDYKWSVIDDNKYALEGWCGVFVKDDLTKIADTIDLMFIRFTICEPFIEELAHGSTWRDQVSKDFYKYGFNKIIEYKNHKVSRQMSLLDEVRKIKGE